ncbi:MAG: nucleotidyltransferase domain-containing protein [Sulfuricellaceae bacterium]
MIKEHQIYQAIQRIVSVAQPSRVILFGSYGRGEANEDSDLDLLVVESEVVDKGREMARLRAAVGFIGIGVDVLVFSEAEIEKKRDWCTNPIYWALREGKVLYEAKH